MLAPVGPVGPVGPVVLGLLLAPGKYMLSPETTPSYGLL